MSTPNHPPAADAHGHDEEHVGHIVPLWLLAAVFAALLAFTIITYTVTFVDLGYTLNLVVAMVIALIKAALVCLYFMHLRWDRPINSVVFIGALFFTTIFVVFALLDQSTYRPTITEGRYDATWVESDPKLELGK